MTALLIGLHVIVCLILILVILLQAGRGQGLTTTFGSGNVQSLLGTRASDFLTKVTSGAAICFLFTCIGLNFIEAQKSRSLLETARPKAPLDVETIKKALEKVKKETGNGKSQIPGSSEGTHAPAGTLIDATQKKEETSQTMVSTVKAKEKKEAEPASPPKTTAVDSKT